MAERSTNGFVLTFTALIKELVDVPDNVSVSSHPGADGSVLLRITTTQEEAGKVIGVGGRTARALRVLLVAVGAAQGVCYTLDIVEPD